MKCLIFGSLPLTQGFGLVGFETYPQATLEQVETVLNSLLSHQEAAFVLLESHLTRTSTGELLPILSKIRREATQIVVTEVPSLSESHTHRRSIEELIVRVLGESVLTPPSST